MKTTYKLGLKLTLGLVCLLILIYSEMSAINNVVWTNNYPEDNIIYNDKEIELNVSNLTTGTYLIIIEGSGRKETYKLIKW